ncbi:MAG: type II toxin-antitoxin system HicB family antitoxin [Pseudomonadota bacterium]|nr:type II toxin-antitoxin system HicB family antitoxin [Pseudomonadota bacterium]
MADYIAFVHDDRTRGYLASFPDLPGLAIVAATLDGVWREAEAGLAIFLRGLVEHGEAVPAPSTLDMLSGEDGYKDAVAVVSIHVPDVLAATVRVNIVLTEAMLREIDERAAVHGFTRAGFLVQAARKALEAA